jgi:hypothetical protein
MPNPFALAKLRNTVSRIRSVSERKRTFSPVLSPDLIPKQDLAIRDVRPNVTARISPFQIMHVLTRFAFRSQLPRPTPEVLVTVNFPVKLGRVKGLILLRRMKFCEAVVRFR